MRKVRPRVIRVNVLPGEPLDGTGKVCIHLFVRDPNGLFIEPHVLHPVLDNQGQPVKQQTAAGPASGRLACNPRRNVLPVVTGNSVLVTMRTDDPRSCTCPKCKASPEYEEMMTRLEQNTV